MRLALLIPLLLAVACGSNGSEADRSDGQAYGIPAGVGPVTEHTVEGGTVWVYDVAVYGPCALIKPHEADLSGWLGIDPPDGYGDYGMVCRD